MNNQLIMKIIKTNDANACPELTFDNPLIDRNVAAALARSFVKILRVSQQDSNINNNLRHSVLANIRKLCRIEPETHLEVNENFTNSLSEVYIDKLRDSTVNDSTRSVERSLDEFLARRMKEINLGSNSQFSNHPEVVQALLNLNKSDACLESIKHNVYHLDVSNKKELALVKNMWAEVSLADSVYGSSNICDDLSIKMKSEIEVFLLNLCYNLLTEPNLKTEEIFIENYILRDLVKKCSISSQCFQICCRILNYLFIHTNYNADILTFVSKFVQNVKNCLYSISILYPEHLCYIVVLLDIKLECLSNELQCKYVNETLVHLKRLYEKSNTELVMLLSHFPHWFHICFPEKESI